MKNNNNNLLFFDIFITILIVGTVTFIKDQSDYSENEKRYKDKYIYCLIRDLVISIIFILSIRSLISNNYNPFLYFRF